MSSTDRRTDGRTRWIQYTPTSLGRGITRLVSAEDEMNKMYLRPSFHESKIFETGPPQMICIYILYSFFQCTGRSVYLLMSSQNNLNVNKDGIKWMRDCPFEMKILGALHICTHTLTLSHLSPEWSSAPLLGFINFHLVLPAAEIKIWFFFSFFFRIFC